MHREQEKAALAIEKSNRRRPAVGGIRSQASAANSTAKKSLKFNKETPSTAPGPDPTCPSCKSNSTKTQ